MDLTGCPVEKIDLSKLSRNNSMEYEVLIKKIEDYKKKGYIMNL